ncbi:MAG: peptidyl-prolyl cis-trans isomerase [Bacteroidetes bacterium]|nr:peptidyl-prolyl cis-trans isomerase [Bacteroidota bacterium]
MKYLLSAVLFSLPLLAAAQGLSDDAVLASVGNEKITVGEFRARFALGIFPYKDQERLTPVVKIQFLYSLIAERLLMAEAERQGFDAEDRFRRNRKMAEEMFMRDRLYRDSVRAHVRVTDEEIHARFVEEQQRIQFEFLFNTSESEIQNLHRLLQSGIPFDTLLAEQQRMTSEEEQSDLHESELDAAFRSRIDAMTPGTVSAPIRGGDGWYIVRKMDYGNPFRSEFELQKRSKRIESQLRMEKEADETKAFVRRLWQGREAHFEDEPYRALGQALLVNCRAQERADTSDMLLPQHHVFDSLRSIWAMRLEQPFLRIGEWTLGIGDALDRFEASDLRLPASELSTFPRLYLTRMHEMADRFLVTMEATRLGLEQHPDVRRDMAMWTANGLAQMIPELLWEQFIASDDSIWNYYVSHPAIFGPPVEVKIVEILMRDEAALSDIIARFRNGEDLHDLAEQYSERPGAADRKGEFGYFPVSENGLIGRTAFGLRIADAAGPVSTPDGFSFFQLVDKRYPGSAISGWDALRDSVTAAARPGLMQRKTDDLLKRLAARGGISVDMKMLEEIPVATMQMFTIRALGFGGRIPAVPGVMPLYEAVMEGMGEGTAVAP